MAVNLFIKKENIQMLWELISDEDIFKFLTPDVQSKIYITFFNNIPNFYESEKSITSTLVDINKKYIMLILNFIQKTYPYKPSKIKIHNEIPIDRQLVTSEDIQNDKKTRFEKDLLQRQSEFENSIHIKPPLVPDFADKEVDQPLKDIDKIVKEMQMRRNYDVEQINKIQNSEENEEWLKQQETSLKPQETSLKPQETSLKPQETSLKPQETSDFPHSKTKHIDKFRENTEKKVSFANENIAIFTQEEEEEDEYLFSKLKKINKEPSIEDRMIHLERNIAEINEKINKIINALYNEDNKK
jgi:hypothetical protein